MKILVLVMAILTAFSVQGQKKKKEDIKAIKSMCGCYKIGFNYAETFSPDKEYKFHDNYRSGALEYVIPIEETKDKIVLQHLLVINDTMIIKHWRQDWLYENTSLYQYDKSNAWNHTTLSGGQVKGQWTQKVYQVGDGPRYEGSASWVHVDGQHFWESKADAPLPRREFSKRSDYNVMARQNRHEITSDGWNHEQDNDKVLREGGQDKLLAQEKGMNTYTKVEETECQPAITWWDEHKLFWTDVRIVWGELYAKKQRMSFDMKKEDKVLFMRLFELDNEQDVNNYNSELVKNKIREVIEFHLKGDLKLAAK